MLKISKIREQGCSGLKETENKMVLKFEINRTGKGGLKIGTQ